MRIANSNIEYSNVTSNATTSNATAAPPINANNITSSFSVASLENINNRAINREELGKICEAIKKHPLIAWGKASGSAICSFRFWVMRFIAESIHPGSSAKISVAGIPNLGDGKFLIENRGVTAYTAQKYYADKFRPFSNLDQDSGEKTLYEDNIDRFSALFTCKHTALLLNVKEDNGTTNMYVIDGGRNKDSVPISKWLTNSLKSAKPETPIKEGFCTINAGYYPLISGPAYTVSDGEISPNINRVLTTLERIFT